MADVAGSYSSPVDLQLPRDAPEIFDTPQLRAMYDILQSASQALAELMASYTGFNQKDRSTWSTLRPTDTILAQNQNRLYVLFSETVALGAMVNLYNNAGVLTARNANATNTSKPASGWCTTSGGGVSGEYGEVILKTGLCTGVSGLTIGTRYWLSTTNGLITATQPAVSGNIQQYIGLALGDQILFMDIQPDYVTVP